MTCVECHKEIPVPTTDPFRCLLCRRSELERLLAIAFVPGPSPIYHVVCVQDNCQALHNENGHHYGCDCVACLHESWRCKR